MKFALENEETNQNYDFIFIQKGPFIRTIAKLVASSTFPGMPQYGPDGSLHYIKGLFTLNVF